MSAAETLSTKPARLPPPSELNLPLSDGEKFPTPLNRIGLVDVKGLVELMNSVVRPGYNWQSDEQPNCHHAYWKRCDYPHLPKAAVNPAVFRNLPMYKLRVPIPFHNLLHLITEPPPVPDKDVMYGQVEANRIIQELYSSASCAVRPLERHSYEAKCRIEQLNQLLENARQLPMEFRPLILDEINVSTVEGIEACARQLGRIALGPHQLEPPHLLRSSLVDQHLTASN